MINWKDIDREALIRDFWAPEGNPAPHLLALLNDLEASGKGDEKPARLVRAALGVVTEINTLDFQGAMALVVDLLPRAMRHASRLGLVEFKRTVRLVARQVVDVLEDNPLAGRAVEAARAVLADRDPPRPLDEV